MIGLTLFVLVFAGVFLIQLLRWYYSASREKVPGWIAKWEFTPLDIGGPSYRQLLIASVLSLFLELLMIRWVSSEVSIFAYFKNFVLVACFLGLGLGCCLSRRVISLLAFVAPLVLLTLVVSSPWVPMRQLISQLPYMLAAGSNVQIWGVPSLTSGIHSIPILMSGLLISAVLFLLIGFHFIPVGQMVGWYLENAKHGITGYTLNILASILGTVLYTALCFWYQPPPIWFAGAALLLGVLLWKQRRLAGLAVSAITFCALFAIPVHTPDTKTYWSPYQKLTLTARPNAAAPEAYDLLTNDSWYQQIVNLSPEFVRAHRKDFENEPIEVNAYNLPYRFYPAPRRVLVLGAGMGNDVAASLRNTTAGITAVEIDPLILQLGRELHFEHPYASQRVHVVVDDARNYIQNTSDRFDLIVFGLLDSHTTSSYYSNIRIDNYVYTVEALAAARQLLSPDSLFVVKFQADTPWIVGRLETLLETVFKQAPIRLHVSGGKYGTGGSFFIVGTPVRIQQAMANPALAEFVKVNSSLPSETAALTTDDWPYFYQQAPGLPLSVILMSLLLVAICGLFLRRGTTGAGSIGWHFFFLGAAFMLLEAQIISKMALLFGTTWVINSIVISGLLLLIVAANLVVQRWQEIPYWVAYAGIFVTLGIGWLVPVHNLFFSTLVLKGLIATLILCSPVFFAGIVFIRSFAQAQFSGKALGSNLFGALVGGLLESLSFWTGLKALLLLAGLLYFASAIALRTMINRQLLAASDHRTHLLQHREEALAVLPDQCLNDPHCGHH